MDCFSTTPNWNHPCEICNSMHQVYTSDHCAIDYQDGYCIIHTSDTYPYSQNDIRREPMKHAIQLKPPVPYEMHRENTGCITFQRSHSGGMTRISRGLSIWARGCEVNRQSTFWLLLNESTNINMTRCVRMMWSPSSCKCGTRKSTKKSKHNNHIIPRQCIVLVIMDQYQNQFHILMT